MANETSRKQPASVSDRKKLLIAQGAMLRADILYSQDMMHAGLRPEALAKSVISHIIPSALNAFKGTGAAASIAQVDLQTVLPLAITGISVVTKRMSVKAAIRAALAIGAIGVMATIISKKKTL